jgi:hypothetical protein
LTNLKKVFFWASSKATANGTLSLLDMAFNSTPKPSLRVKKKKKCETNKQIRKKIRNSYETKESNVNLNITSWKSTTEFSAATTSKTLSFITLSSLRNTLCMKNNAISC